MWGVAFLNTQASGRKVVSNLSTDEAGVVCLVLVRVVVEQRWTCVAIVIGKHQDNVFIERLWRSLKYECVYLAEFATGSQARTGISWWMDFYNERRPHSALDDRTPQEAYTDGGAAQSPGDAPSPSSPRSLES